MRRAGWTTGALGQKEEKGIFSYGNMLTVLPLVLVLGACAVGPNYIKPPIAVPPGWSNVEGRSQSASAPELARWWTRLNDTLLNTLIEKAAHGNLDVAVAKARIREARATYRQATGALYPTLQGGSSATRQRSSASGAGAEPQTSTQYKAGFDSSWEIDFFGKNRRSAEAAGYGVEAAEEQLRLALLTLVGDVASNYIQARGYQARIALAQRTSATQHETADLTRARFEAGAASAVDLANATGQMNTTEAAIPSLESAYAEAVHRLSVLTGGAPGDLAERMERREPIPRPLLPIPAGIPADILLSRPDVRRAERLLAQATARIGEAEAARFPTVTLTGSISTSGMRIGDLGKNSSIGWSFGPSLSIPIFNGGRLRAAVEVAQAERDQNFVTYRAVVLRSLEEVENALVTLAQEQVRYDKLALSVESYRQASTLSRRLYEGGSADFLTVLDAERSLYSAEDAMMQSRITLANSYVALNKALGGGWDGAVDTSKPEVVDKDMGPRFAP